MREVKNRLPEGSELLWTPENLAAGVAEIAAVLDNRFTERPPEQPPLLVGVMPEATFFTADLMRKLTYGPINFDFLNFTNRSHGSSGHLLSVGPYPALANRQVTFLHTRVISGTTIQHLSRVAAAQGAASTMHVALIHQPGQRTVDKPDISMLTPPDHDTHLFGYGLPYTRGGQGSNHVALSGIYQQLRQNLA